MMKVQIRGGGVKVSAALRAHTERRLAFALARFGERVGQVVVRLSATGGVNRCQIDLGLHSPTISIEDSDADPFAAVNYASDRASTSVARALERERQWDERPPIRPPRRGGRRS